MMKNKFLKILSILLCLSLIFEQTGFAQVAGQLDISGHLAAFRNSFAPDVFRPLHLRYLSYDSLNNNFRLFLDKGSLKNPKNQEVEKTTKELLNYFFIGITLPNDAFWVNLRPDAETNIIDDQVGQTDVGRILLESDLQLKKDTARFTSPQTPEGKEYWDKLYKKAGEIYGSQNVTIPTLTRPWIVPDEIIIRETQDSAYIYKATLKVMLEQDYLKDLAVYNFKDDRLKELNEYSSQLIREIIIPKLTQEVNSSKRYASLRQVYYSLIMAQWFKARFTNKDGLYSRIIDRRVVFPALHSKESWSKTTYFQAYQKSFKDGEYNIEEPVYSVYGQTIRSYFSGGEIFDLGRMPQLGGAVRNSSTGSVISSIPTTGSPAVNPKVVVGVKVNATDNLGELGQVQIESHGIEVSMPSGQMKPLGIRDPMDEDSELDLSRRHSEFEALAASTKTEDVYRTQAKVVQGNLGNIGSYHFYSAQYGLIIVVNLKYPNTWEEGKFHEAREVYWMSKGFSQHEAHVIASAEQIQRFSNDNNLTPYHALQVKNLSPELREAIQKENRTWHHNILERANRAGAAIDIGKVKIYEQVLRDNVAMINRSYVYPAGAIDIRVSNPNNNYCQTSEGAISIGMTMGYRLLFPEASNYPRVIIAPRDEWRGNDGENIMQLYFAIAANFAFHKRKTIIVCQPEQKQRIIRYLELGNPYYLPNIAGYPQELIDRFRREAIYLADRMVIDGKTQMATPFPDMVEFVEFSGRGEANIGTVSIKDQSNGTYVVSDSVRSQEKVLDGKDMRELTVDLNGVTPLSEIPEFGVTFLGTSSGMDPNGLPSNQIIWAGNNHILIDVNAPTLATLSSLKLSPRNITHIVITHMHEDHVAGALAYMEWCKRNGHPIRLIIEPGIYELFREQVKQILNRDIESVYEIQIVPLTFYKDLVLGQGEESLLIEPAPAFHGTPTTMLRFTYKGHTITHSSDTTFDPVRFEQILQNKIPDNIRAELQEYVHAGSDVSVFDRKRSEELSEFLLRPNQNGQRPEVIIYEGGNAAAYEENKSNHTTPFALQKLPEGIQHTIYVNHTAKLPVGTTFGFRHAFPFSTVKVEIEKTNVPVVKDILSVSEPSALAKSVISKGVVKKGQRILSLGSGNGNDELFFAQQGCEVVASDNNSEILRHLREKAKNTPHLSIQEIDVEQPFNLPASSFDVVYIRLVLDYFSDSSQQRILSQIHQILKPGGIAIIQLKSKNDILYQQGEKITIDDGMFYFPQKKYSRNHLSLEELESKIRLVNLEMVDSSEHKERLYGDDYESTLVSAICMKNNGGASSPVPILEEAGRALHDTNIPRGNFGGIDFRNLPIVTQAIGNLNANIGSSSINRFNSINLNSEWRDIENLVNSGITPSPERIKEYVQASCYKESIDRDIDKVLSCISDILRIEEERYSPTDPTLKDILVVLDSANSVQQLRAVFIGTTP